MSVTAYLNLLASSSLAKFSPIWLDWEEAIAKSIFENYTSSNRRTKDEETFSISNIVNRRLAG